MHSTTKLKLLEMFTLTWVFIEFETHAGYTTNDCNFLNNEYAYQVNDNVCMLGIKAHPHISARPLDNVLRLLSYSIHSGPTADMSMLSECLLELHSGRSGEHRGGIPNRLSLPG